MLDIALEIGGGNCEKPVLNGILVSYFVYHIRFSPSIRKLQAYISNSKGEDYQ